MEESTANITYEPAMVDESLIINPGGAISQITVPMVSTAPPGPYKDLVVNVETTGVEPYDKRIICIGVKDPETPEIEPYNFFDLDEYAMINNFLAYFTAGGFNRIVGYNTIFDKRFIFAKALYYRLTCKEFALAEIYDIMDIMTKVLSIYTPGTIKGYTLDNWAGFLLGMNKTMTFEQQMIAYNAQDYQSIMDYNFNNVNMTWILYELVEACRNNMYMGESFGTPPISP